MSTKERPGGRLMDRPEYRSKPDPLTRGPEAVVTEAAFAMSEKNYGCVIVVDEERRVIGVVTERDIMNKVVGRDLDPSATTLGEIMTENPRVASETDLMLDWLRMMSNERFRRLPVVDDAGRIKAVFTQGDFVSYTWPELLGHMGALLKAQATGHFHYLLIGGGILIYTLAMVIVLSLV